MRLAFRHRCLVALVAALAAGALAAAAPASAAPTITDAPSDPTANPMPTFAGGGAVPATDVQIVIAPVGIASDPPDLVATAGLLGEWSAAVGPPGLPDGTYTATATQGLDSSAPVQFRVDTTPPAVTLRPLPEPSTNTTPTFIGRAGTDLGDSETVTVEVRAGFDGAGALVLSQPVARDGAFWGTTAPPLSPGRYSVRATQSDSLAHTGQTPWRDFTIAAPPPPPPPPDSLSAPPAPDSLAATTQSGAGGQTKTFVSTGAPAPTAVAAPRQARAALMLVPYPIVRIVGKLTRAGARVTLLTVSATRSMRVRALCTGRGCPQTRLRAKRRKHAAIVYIPRLQGRALRAGTVIEVFVTSPARIGKYTRFQIRRGRPPSRRDRCLAVDGRTPISCPGA